MDSTNFQHHEHHQQQQQHQQQQHLQDHFVGCSPLNIPSSCYGVSSTNDTSLQWSNSTILPTSTTTSTNNTTFSNKPYEENDFLSSTTQVSNMPKIEDDMLSSFPSFSSLIQHATNAPNLDNINPWSFNSLLSSASGVPYSRGLMQQFPLEVNNWSNNNTSHGYPSNTSILNQLGLVSSPNNSPASTVSSSSPRLGMNLQAMDFLGNNSSFGAQNRPMSSYDVLGGEEVISPIGKIMPNKTSTLMNNGSLTGTKRAAGSSSSDQSKASTSSNHVGTKKSPLKVSCPPFKVRKEKLGERIAALHQLVSPFGKTDTASVLTEAIGYIQFLQDQIHTLCMPQGHAKPSRSKPCRPFQMGLGSGEDDAKEDEERVELRRRGLCLVPFSWSSFVTPNQLDASNHSPYY